MFEDPAQGLGVDLAGQPQPRGARAHPHPGRLLGAGVVLLQPSGDRVQVVLLLARGQLPQAQHRPTAPPAR